MYNLVSTLTPKFLMGSSSFLQVRSAIKSRMSSNFSRIPSLTADEKFGQIRPQTAELAALERLKKTPIDL